MLEAEAQILSTGSLGTTDHNRTSLGPRAGFRRPKEFQAQGFLVTECLSVYGGNPNPRPRIPHGEQILSFSVRNKRPKTHGKKPACEDFYTVIEQPSSSAMFKMKVTSSLAKQLEMERVWTWMGLFGHEPWLDVECLAGCQGDIAPRHIVQYVGCCGIAVTG